MFAHLFVIQKRILIEVGVVYTEIVGRIDFPFVFSSTIGFNFLCIGSTC